MLHYLKYQSVLMSYLPGNPACSMINPGIHHSKRATFNQRQIGYSLLCLSHSHTHTFLVEVLGREISPHRVSAPRDGVVSTQGQAKLAGTS